MSAATVPSSQGLLEALEEFVDVVTGRDIDELAVPEVREELEGLERVRRRIEARQCRLADSMRRRRARVLAETRADPARAERQARRQTERELKERLSWSHSEAKRATRLGEALPTDGDGGAGAGAAFDEGRLPPRHAQVLAKTLGHLEGEQRADAEAQLLARAREEDAVTFGRSCRRLLAELDHDAAATAEDRRRARRSGRIAQTADGMLAVSAQLSGLDAEVYASAVHAFRRPDATGEHRSPQQATADAMAQMARAALKLGEAPPSTAFGPTRSSPSTGRPSWRTPVSPREPGPARCRSRRSGGCWRTAGSPVCSWTPRACRSRRATRCATSPWACIGACSRVTAGASGWAATRRRPGAR